MADPKKLAVLIDADNTSPKVADALFEEVAKIGEASLRRIYGDFSKGQHGGWEKILARHAILAQQQFAYTTGKNSSDIALVIDAMDLLHSGRFDGFCLVSSALMIGIGWLLDTMFKPQLSAPVPPRMAETDNWLLRLRPLLILLTIVVGSVFALHLATGVAVTALNGAVPVAHAAITLVEQLISGDGVLLDVPLDEVEIPCAKRVELE